jgi:hypothetical protein
MTKREIVRLPSMAAAVAMERETFTFQGSRAGARLGSYACRDAVSGDPEALHKAMQESDALIDLAVACEPRLARRPQWTRGDDGIWADAGLVASGDDSPCYGLTRSAFRDQAASGEPVNVVVSTDSSTPTSLAAFIATVRIVQQFRPVNVWWQGAWLADDGGNAGYVFLTPLVTNDMDFSRVQFVVQSPYRDHLSFGVFHAQATIRDRRRINGCGLHAEYSFMDGSNFVGRDGIKPTPERIASRACMWLDWETPSGLAYERDRAAEAALQRIPPPPSTSAGKWTTSASDDKWQRERDARTAAEARDRMAKVQAGNVVM